MSCNKHGSRCLFKTLISDPLNIYSVVRYEGHMVVLCIIFWGTSILFFIKDVLIYIPPNNKKLSYFSSFWIWLYIYSSQWVIYLQILSLIHEHIFLSVRRTLPLAFLVRSVWWVIDSLSFCLSREVFISPLFLKGRFSGYTILG